MEVRVSYSKGVATHADPESCVCTRKGACEALTGARAGQVMSRERKMTSGGRRSRMIGRQHGTVRYRQNDSAPAWSRDPVHVRKLLTREPGDPASDPREIALGSALRIRKEHDSDARRREVGQADSS